MIKWFDLDFSVVLAQQPILETLGWPNLTSWASKFGLGHLIQIGIELGIFDKNVERN